MLLVLRVLISLGVVLGLFWMVARMGSKRLGVGRDRALVRVRGRQALSRGSSLAVVEVGNRVLVVGVSDGGVRLLTEMDPRELADPAPVVESAVVDSGQAADQTYDPAYEQAYDAAYARAYESAHESAYDAAHGTHVVEAQPLRPVTVVAHPSLGSSLGQSVGSSVGAASSFEDYLAEARQVVEDRPTTTVAARPAAASRVTGSAPRGALSGSLLSASTWRQAWGTATGRAYRPQDGDAA